MTSQDRDGAFAEAMPLRHYFLPQRARRHCFGRHSQ